MHRSRLSGFIIDCQSADLQAATAFWSAALGLGLAKHGADEPTYVRLDGSSRDMEIEVQTVSHPSRVHLDIESDDVEAEVARLEQLGARRVEQVKTWWVMEAPTGQRFCVVRAKSDLAERPGAQAWK
jgi:catechol 2,3-dioxygenase-like lactoylglutathione lyase family enzyme